MTSPVVPRRLAGRCADGAERGGGKVAHGVLVGAHRALCGAKPGRLSGGWQGAPCERVTCPRCIKAAWEGDNPMTPTAAQLAALRFFDGFPPDGTARAEWIMEYAERRYMRAGNDGDAAYRLRAETAHRIVERCVAAGWIDASAWCLTDAGREALEAPNKGGK